jgi:dTMP kinase
MFVTFEGPEGGGKTTLIRGLRERLEGDGFEVVTTREPGAGDVGGRIREILLHGEALDAKAELLLFLADRAQHVASLVRPALERGAVVLCDRFADSTVVYQGYGRDLPLDDLRQWNAFATGGLRPDLTFVLDLDPAVGLARVQDVNRLDREPLAFHQRIRDGFLAEARREPDRFMVLDASKPAQTVLDLSYREVRSRLEATS